MLALIAGGGNLPARLYDKLGDDVLICEMKGFPSGLPDPVVFEVERLGSFLRDLRKRGTKEVCFAGAVRRPAVDMKRIDARTLPIVPRMMKAIGQGDDGLLRTVIALFEEQGMTVRGAHELLPELLPVPGVATCAQPGDRDRSDAARAVEIHHALAAADVGQGCVVARGLALAVETLGGTDWMLRSLSRERPEGPNGGILFKAPKAGQDRRVDLPVVGSGTVEGAAAAGLSGIVIEAEGVMVMDIDDMVSAADRAGLFLWVRPS